MDDLANKLKEYEDAKLSADEKEGSASAELESSLAEATERYTKLERTRLVESFGAGMGLPGKFWKQGTGSH